MKKAFVSLCMAATLMGMSSCASTKNVATPSSLGGEWNIIEINGSAVVSVLNQEFPFTGFDIKIGKVYGNSGCNRMMGSFDVNAKPGTINLGALDSTRMACPDMTAGKNVLSALDQVKKYKVLGENNTALYDSSKRPPIVLQKKEPTVKLSELNGKWMISQVGGEAIPSGMEKQPFIKFNISEKRLCGDAGCNIINGGFQADKVSPISISFLQMISIMMACPDMEVENRMLKTLNSAQSFGKLSGRGMGFYDANDNLVMVLVRK